MDGEFRRLVEAGKTIRAIRDELRKQGLTLEGDEQELVRLMIEILKEKEENEESTGLDR